MGTRRYNDIKLVLEFNSSSPPVPGPSSSLVDVLCCTRAVHSIAKQFPSRGAVCELTPPAE